VTREPGAEPGAGTERGASREPAPDPTPLVEPDESTQPVDLGESTQPVDVADETGPFAPAHPPSGPLVSPTAASMLLADAMPPTAAPEPAVPDPTSGIDALFGTSQFRAYDTPDPAPPAPVRRPAPTVAPRHPMDEPPHMTSTQRVLLIVAGVLVGLVALSALFYLGTRLPVAAEPEPGASRSAAPKPTPTPVPTVLPPGPVPAGTHRWDALLGGECLKEYPGPWAERYTVVDCASPHPAQLVFRGRFADPATPGYPGAAELQKQMPILCSAPGVIDLAAAAQYTDAQIEASFPATAAQWDAGDHWYYCFVSRASKGPLTGSVAVPRPAPGS
jgi:hypothetical protein